MSGRKYVSAIVIVALMVLSSVLLLTSRDATAATVLWTSDMDFSGGNFGNGSGFQVQLHGTGAAAYIQNTKDAANWLRQYPPTDTGERAGFAFANDSYESRFILFGGLDNISTVRNDTWEYDVGTTNWVRICSDDTPACAPPRRYVASMAYSNASKVAVMYGGYNADFVALADTWEYDVTTNTWTNRTGGTQPRALGAHRMVYDPVGNQIILVGVTSTFTAMETWNYSIPTHKWTQKTFTGTFSPRSSFSLGYNYETGYKRVVLFGGSGMMTQYSDTFEYNPQTNVWVNTTPATSPSARYDAEMVYSYKTGIEGLTLWGGGPASVTETWKYYHEAGVPTWLQLTVATAPSPGRRQFGMGYDHAYDKMILYGGSTVPSGPRLNDTWALENGFRLEGKYVSLYFNTYDAGTTWQDIWWNQTPANVPPNTYIRIQLNVSNACDEGASFLWYGPNKVQGSYFLTPGAALGPQFSGFKCIKYLADLITNDASVAPMFEDIALDYAFIPKPPTIESKSPTGPMQPTTAWIYINFSKAMDPSTVSVSVNPNVTIDTPWGWYQGNTKVILKHDTDPFHEGLPAYTVCVWGADTTGIPLDTSVFANHCWIFTTIAIPPQIVSHTPNQGDVGVGLSTPIVITFDKAMDTTTCWPVMTIDPNISFSHAWDLGDTRLTMTPTTQYKQFTLYTVEMPVGDPLRPCKGANNQLLFVGGPANPWSFQTLANDPYIVETDPTHLNPFIKTSTKLWINFSRFMDTSAGGMSFYIHDLTLSGTNVSATSQWTPNNRSLVLTPTAALPTCHAFEVRIWARDFVMRTLIPNPNVPNPWRFFTGGSSGTNGCAPYMIFTSPAEGEWNISPFQNITIGWQYWPDGMSGGGMNTGSFTFAVTDPFGIPVTNMFTKWWYGMGNAALQLNHSGYQMLCGQYTVRTLTARDNQGRAFITGTADNPFHFTVNATVCPPVVLRTSPANGTMNAPLSNPIIIKYSKTMNTTSVEQAFNLRPSKTPYVFTWSQSDTNVSITHASFVACEFYNATSVGRDLDGNYLIPGPVPNPWMFRGDCVFGPKINQTYPANGQQGIPLTAPIWVNFTEPVQTGTFSFNLNPGAGTLTNTWSGDRKSVKITHSTAYTECTPYTATVIDVLNDTGFHLVAGPVPNPWTFKSYCPPPRIMSTIPPDGALNVGLSDPITVVFDKTMDKTSFVISVINTQPPAPPLTFNTPSWPNGQTAVVTHTAQFAVCTKYTVRVTARDTFGTNLGPGPVPNPWNFTTDCRFPLQNLQVHRAGNDVQLTWNVPSSGAAWYLVYHANNRLAAWPWAELDNVTTNSYTHVGAISDLDNHFYIVRGFKADGSSSSNSTMGALWHMRVTPNPTTNTFWFSLPYNPYYKRASDIATELGTSKTKVVAKWDPAKQQSILYYYLNGKWRGNNFPIAAGDGLWIGIESAFDWAINGTDKIAGLIFSFKPSARTNYYWISLPLTTKYGAASQVVLAIAGSLGPGSDTKIDEIGKWDFATQTSLVFKYGTTGWGGTDFVINSGDAIWLRIKSSFSWSPELVTPEVL